MNHLIAKRQVLTVGMILSLIFIAISTNYAVHGGEFERAAHPAKRSRKHPNRFFSGIRRGVSKLFRRPRDKRVKTVAFEPSAPNPSTDALTPPVPEMTVGEQISNVYTKRGTHSPTAAAGPRRSGRAQTASPGRRGGGCRKGGCRSASSAQTAGRAFDGEGRPACGEELDGVEESGDAEEATVSTEVEKSPFEGTEISQVASRPGQAPEIEHLLGYCTVNLRRGKFRRGNQAYREVFQGRTYTFDSAEAQNEFRRTPTLFAPVMRGIDVVELTHTGHHAEGYLSFSCDYDDHFYLFRTEENQEEFLANPAAFAVPGE